MRKGRAIAAAVAKANVISCVGYQMRYLPHVAWARSFLQGKAISLVAGNRWGGIPGGPDHWWRVMERSGGMLHEMATHNLDLMRCLVGDVVRVSARYASHVLSDVPNLTVPDSQVVLLEFANGANGYFSTSCALTKAGGWSSVDIIARDVMLRIGFGEVAVIPEGAVEVNLPPPGMTIQQAFIHAIRTGDRSVIRSDYHDALKTAAVTLAANQSAKTGKPVTLSA